MAVVCLNSVTRIVFTACFLSFSYTCSPDWQRYHGVPYKTNCTLLSSFAAGLTTRNSRGGVTFEGAGWPFQSLHAASYRLTDFQNSCLI
jgi:hypothetical protein